MAGEHLGKRRRTGLRCPPGVPLADGRGHGQDVLEQRFVRPGRLVDVNLLVHESPGLDVLLDGRDTFAAVNAEPQHRLGLTTYGHLPDPERKQDPLQIEQAVACPRRLAVPQQVIHPVRLELAADEVLGQRVLSVLLVQQSRDHVHIHAVRGQEFRQPFLDDPPRPVLMARRIVLRRHKQARQRRLEEVRERAVPHVVQQRRHQDFSSNLIQFLRLGRVVSIAVPKGIQHSACQMADAHAVNPPAVFRTRVRKKGKARLSNAAEALKFRGIH